MEVREKIPLSTLTTFKVGGYARYTLECETVDDLKEALRFARDHDLPWYVIGEGSNLLTTDEGYYGVLIHNRIQGVERHEEDHHTILSAGAGVHWDDVATEAGKRGLWGIENLAGIPGTVGAAPVQNIGAYGVELADILEYVEAYDTKTGVLLKIPGGQCRFAYRDSRFKCEPNLLITKVALRLSHKALPRLEYKDLAALEEAGEDLSSPRLIGEAVRRIRAQKFPDLSQYGTAGSFFKNPILTQEAYDALTLLYGEVPNYPSGDGIKIPLAFVLDTIVKLKGFRRGHAFLFENQPLVLTCDLGAKAEEIESLAQFVAARVEEKTGIKIDREVRTLE